MESGVLYYDYLYRGYPDDEEFHDKKQMNDSLISKIKLKIEELSLYRNYEKKFPSDESGYFTESGSTLSVTTDTEKYYIKISGPRPIEIDDEVYNKLSEFYYFLDSVFPQKP